MRADALHFARAQIDALEAQVAQLEGSVEQLRQSSRKPHDSGRGTRCCALPHGAFSRHARPYSTPLTRTPPLSRHSTRTAPAAPCCAAPAGAIARRVAAAGKHASANQPVWYEKVSTDAWPPKRGGVDALRMRCAYGVRCMCARGADAGQMRCRCGADAGQMRGRCGADQCRRSAGAVCLPPASRRRAASRGRRARSCSRRRRASRCSAPPRSPRQSAACTARAAARSTPA